MRVCPGERVLHGEDSLERRTRTSCGWLAGMSLKGWGMESASELGANSLSPRPQPPLPDREGSSLFLGWAQKAHKDVCLSRNT